MILRMIICAHRRRRNAPVLEDDDVDQVFGGLELLAVAAFDRFIGELDKPTEVIPELAELFRRHQKLPEG